MAVDGKRVTFAEWAAKAATMTKPDDVFVAEMAIALKEVTTDGEIMGTFGCRHFEDAIGRCGVHDRKPHMCSQFPSNLDRPCSLCGARSDAEARGVAMMVAR